jgi:hypothetical protein
LLDAVEREETRAARSGRRWRWRLLLPRVAGATAILVVAGLSLHRYEIHLQRTALARELASAASAPAPGVEALVNLDAIERMSQSGHADGDLLAALQ